MGQQAKVVTEAWNCRKVMVGKLFQMNVLKFFLENIKFNRELIPDF